LSLAFPDPACDESIIQRAVAKHLGMTQILLRFDRAVEPHGMLWSALALNREWPTPMIDPWRPAYRTLKTQGRERGCTRVLTGTGGDEWLNVTSRFLADQLGQLDLAGAARTIRTTLRSYRLPLLAHLRIMIWKYGLRPLLGSYVARGLAAWAPGVLAAHRRRDLMSATPAWVAPDDTIRRECAARVDASVERMNDLPRFKGPYRFYFADLPGMFLHPLNQMDMEERFESAQRIGVSERHPYWDPDLVRFLCRVPPDLLTRGGRTKALVRATVARRFPALGFERHKKVSGQDFFIRAMRTEGPDCWRRLGGLETLGNLGVVDARAAERDVLQRLATDRNAPQHLWILLNLESWVRAHA
jgi:asparagine synthetase B (glutamine-hydrolysing)